MPQDFMPTVTTLPALGDVFTVSLSGVLWSVSLRRLAVSCWPHGRDSKDLHSPAESGGLWGMAVAVACQSEWSKRGLNGGSLVWRP